MSRAVYVLWRCVVSCQVELVLCYLSLFQETFQNYTALFAG